MNPRDTSEVESPFIDEALDVLVSGAGPTGLAVAYEAVKAGLTVGIVSNRSDDFVRVQRVTLTGENRRYLVNMISKDETPSDRDLKFLHTIKTVEFIAIKDIESFLKARLDHLKEQHNLILYYFDKIITKVNLENGVATIETVDTNEIHKKEFIGFNRLVGADGVGRHALSLVNDQLAKPISFVKTPTDLPTFHASAYVSLQGAGIHDIVADKIAQIWGESKPGEKKHENLLFYYEGHQVNLIFTPGNQAVKCNIVLELPPEIAQITEVKQRNAAIKQYISDVIKFKFPDSSFSIETVTESKKHGPKKDNTKYTFFSTVDIEQATLASAPASVGYRSFYLVGDAYRTPHYRTAKGLSNGLAQARGLGEVFNDKINNDQYNELSSQLGREAAIKLKEVELRSDSIRKNRLNHP